MSEKHTCCGASWAKGSYRPKTCGKTAKFERDGKWYCGTHDPVAIEAKRVKQNAEFQAKWDARTAAQEAAEAKRKETQRRANCFDELVDALKHYANGSNWGKDHEGVLREWREPDSSTPEAYEGFTIARAALKKAQGEV